MPATKEKKKRRFSGRLTAFIIILLFVCGLIIFNNLFASGSFRRLSYMLFSGISGDGESPSVSFDTNEYNKFALCDGNLCVVSPQELSVYKINGNINFSEPVILRSPSIAMSKSRFIAYDLGGLNFYVADSNKILYSGTTDSKIISVNINTNGDFAVVTDGTDSRTLVTVYNSSFQVVYKFHSSEQYVMDAAVSPNAKEAAVLTYGASSGKFTSELSLCRTNENGFYITLSLGESVPLKVSYHKNDKILVICDDKTIMYNTDGSVSAEIPYSDSTLKAYTMNKDNQIVLLLDDYQGGGNNKLIFANSIGQITGELKFDEDIYSISTSGKYTSIQFSEKCVVYNDVLAVHCEFPIAQTISQCIVKQDSAVVSVGPNFASLFVI